MPIDDTQAKALLERGLLNQDTYDRAFSNGPMQQPVLSPGQGTVWESTTMEQIPSKAPQTPQELKQDPSMMFRTAAGDVKKQEIEAQRQELNKRAEVAKKLGQTDEQIQAKLAPALEDLEKQERSLLMTTRGDKNDGLNLTTDIQQPENVDQRDMLPSIPAMASIDLQQQAVGMAAQAGASRAMEQAAQIKTMQQEVEQMNKANLEAQARENEMLQEKSAELDAEVDRVSQLKVDPNKFWADRSTGDKITLGISLFLGALGGARTGVNQAVNIIDQAINRDIEAQQANILQQTRGVDRKRGLLSDMRLRFKDNEQARAAVKMAYLQDAQMKVNEIAARYEAPEIRAKAAQMIGQLETQKEQLKATFMQKALASMPVDGNVNAEMLTPDQRERFVPGYGLALTKDSAVKAREAVATIDSIKDNIDELLALSNKSGSSFSPQDRAKAETITSILTGQLRLPIVGPGAVSEKELELLQRIIADPTRIMSLDANNKQRLRTLKQRMDKQTSDQLRQFGLQSPTEKLGFSPLK